MSLGAHAAIRRMAGRTSFHMAVAFLAMGGWALLANRGHSPARMLAAAAVQGTLSALLTLFLKSAVERLARRFRGASALWAPPAIAIACSAMLLVAIHALAGTPEIAGTVALPLLVSSSYAALYNLALYRKEQHAP
ncbi:hypothetical protein [Mycoplana sp. MJR14]|uniref:hypothetical protein n=1 Tax=Mycoplana sp. MJR14 TaxID=3032583 RepID=UPI0023DA35B7|nr:hypothetical protein [Mycoplana sp. MJR14]MDF1634143.1 hypothetical protein [Mycoplana sp. MJR14]